MAVESNITQLVVAAVIVAVIIFVLIALIAWWCWRRNEKKRHSHKKMRSLSMATGSTMATKSTKVTGLSQCNGSAYYIPTAYQYPGVTSAMHLSAYRPQYIATYEGPENYVRSEARMSPRSTTEFQYREAVYIAEANGDVSHDKERWKHSRPKLSKHPEWIRKSYEETAKVLDMEEEERLKRSSTRSQIILSQNSKEHETKTPDDYTIVDYVVTKNRPASSSVFTTTISQTSTAQNQEPSPLRSPSRPSPLPLPPPSPKEPESLPTMVKLTHVATGYSPTHEQKVIQEAEIGTAETEIDDYLLSQRQRRPKEGDVEFKISSYEVDETSRSEKYKPDLGFQEGIPEDKIQQEFVARVTSHGYGYQNESERHEHHEHHEDHEHHHHDNEHHVDYRVIRKSGRKPSWLGNSGSWFKRGKKKSTEKN